VIRNRSIEKLIAISYLLRLYRIIKSGIVIFCWVGHLVCFGFLKLESWMSEHINMHLN